MSINIRKVGEVADGSVTAAKLADGAVDLSTAKVSGELPSGKLADGAVIESKLNDLAVSTAKLQNNAVTLAKADDDANLSHFVGDETEVFQTGTVEEIKKEFRFAKVAGQYSPKKIRAMATLKTTNALHQATLKIYFDSEGTARLTFNSSSETYELVSGEADVSDLTAGIHTCYIKLVSADGSEKAYNDFIDIMWVKG